MSSASRQIEGLCRTIIELREERDRYREALERLAGWQPHTPRGLDELHPQHIEAILDARAALATPDTPPDA